MEKHILKTLLRSVILGTTLISCATGKTVQTEEPLEYQELDLSSMEKMDPDMISHTLRTPEQLKGKTKGAEEYSHRTVIVTLAENVTPEQIDSLAEDFGLSVGYKYSIINGCSLSSPRDLTDKELDELISRLEKDSRVISVSKDQIYYLNPPNTLVDF